ncbi:ABC transporter permease [Natronospora cellulosivora (SeqCode)]
MRAFRKMFIANSKEFTRDRSGLFWFFVLPVIFIFLFGLVFTGEGAGIEFDYVMPGILAMALMQLGIFGSLQFLSLREKKIIRGLNVTPLSKGSLLSSEIVLRLLSGLVQASVIITIAILVFDISLVGQLYKIFFLVLLGAATFISLGYMLICFVSSMEGGNGIVQVVQFPMMFLSGIFVPIDILPGFIQPVVRVIPLTYLGDALRQVMVGVPGEFPLLINILVLLSFLIITSILCLKFWKWE